jgi:hypothetical protein
MWSVIKIDRKKIGFFKEEIKKKLGEDCEFYTPKLHIEGLKNNKKINKEIYLLGDYIFCFNENFKNKKILQHLKNTRGLKYFLDGFISAQDEILKFIKKCKSLENKEGFIKQNVFSIYENKNYKFLSGPLAGTLLKVLELNKNKLSVLVENVKVQINRKNYLFEPV